MKYEWVLSDSFASFLCSCDTDLLYLQLSPLFVSDSSSLGCMPRLDYRKRYLKVAASTAW